MERKMTFGKLPKLAQKKLITATPNIFYGNHEQERKDPKVDKLIITNILNKTNERLEKVRQTSRDVRKKLDAQWRHLEKDEQTFKDLIVRHNKFSRNNFEKRVRALAKLEQSRQMVESRKNSVKDMKIKIEYLRAIKKMFSNELSKMIMYENFLIKTIESEGSPFQTLTEFLNQFETRIESEGLPVNALTEFLNQFETLEAVSKKRTKAQIDESKKLLKLQNLLLDTLYRGNSAFVGFRNQISLLSDKYKDLVRKNIVMHVTVAEIVTKINTSMGELYCIRHMIDSMYNYICYRRKVVPHALSNFIPKLKYIKRTMNVWSEEIGQLEEELAEFESDDETEIAITTTIIRLSES